MMVEDFGGVECDLGFERRLMVGAFVPETLITTKSRNKVIFKKLKKKKKKT